MKSVDKREGGGSHNWGTFEDEIKAEDDKQNTSTSEGETNNNENADKNQDGDHANAEPREEEPATMTLDEWKAQQVRLSLI